MACTLKDKSFRGIIDRRERQGLHAQAFTQSEQITQPLFPTKTTKKRRNDCASYPAELAHVCKFRRNECEVSHLDPRREKGVCTTHFSRGKRNGTGEGLCVGEPQSTCTGFLYAWSMLPTSILSLPKCVSTSVIFPMCQEPCYDRRFPFEFCAWISFLLEFDHQDKGETI